MNCWEILGIDAYSDKKTIKIAYAKLLKVHRPDEDPEGFQRLHAAYKNALQWIPVEYQENETPWMTDDGKPAPTHTSVFPVEASDSLDSIESSQVETTLSIDQSKDEDNEFTLETQQFSEEDWPNKQPPVELSEADEALLSEINDQEDHLSKDWNTLYTKVNEIIKSPKQVNTVASWQFIESLPSMRDLEFRKAAADKVFEVVAEVNEASLLKKNLYIQRPVINYLNGQFGWDKKWQQYEYDYSRTLVDAIFPYLAEAERPVKGISKKRELYYYRRGAAFAIDMVILLVIALILNAAVSAWGEEETKLTVLAWWVGIYMLLLIPLQESSQYQGTVGKRVMGLQVITARGDRLSFLHAFLRSAVTVFCCLAIKVVLFINMVLSWWRSELLQDTLTLSYVKLKSRR